MQHIGIVGCSAEGAALCYRTICIEGAKRNHEHHPEVTMHTHSFGEYMEAADRNDWEAVADLMVSSATTVASAGADFAICPDNTVHQPFARVVEKSPIPWLHIAEVVADEAAKSGFGRLGILGTRYLMTGPVYSGVLDGRGIAHEIPAESDRETINSIIFDELVKGVFDPRSREILNRIIGGLGRRGCDAVVLGCTELPLLVEPARAPLPTLDSTRLLARAALTRAGA